MQQKLAALLLVGIVTMLTTNTNAYVTHIDFRFDSNEEVASNGRSSSDDDLKKAAKDARTVVHNADWTAFGTISSVSSMAGFPMVNVISVADSARGDKSTGHIIYLLTDLDYTGTDLKKENKLTMLFSEEENLTCSKRAMDPMEPPCIRVIITGKNVIMDTKSSAYEPALSAFISRHPAAKHWMDTHNFYLCTVEIEQVGVLNAYGGPKILTAEQFYNADMNGDDDGAELMDKYLYTNKTKRNHHLKITVDDDHEINIEV